MHKFTAIELSLLQEAASNAYEIAADVKSGRVLMDSEDFLDYLMSIAEFFDELYIAAYRDLNSSIDDYHGMRD